MFAYPFGVLEDFALGIVVVFCVLHHAFKVALDLGNGAVRAGIDLVLDGINGYR